MKKNRFLPKLCEEEKMGKKEKSQISSTEAVLLETRPLLSHYTFLVLFSFFGFEEIARASS